MAAVDEFDMPVQLPEDASACFIASIRRDA
jgi:hypothetical protein